MNQNEGSPRPRLRSSKTRGPETIEAIIETAERLWGSRGVEGASLREISVAAGSLNKSSIGYHFGDKGGLIAAILSRRIPIVEKRRHPLLGIATTEGKLDDPRTLLRILYQPVLEQVDRDGRRSYAAFLRAINRFPLYEGKEETLVLTPSSSFVVDRLKALSGNLPQVLFDARMRLVNELCYRAITESDRVGPDLEGGSMLADQIFDDALQAGAYLLLLNTAKPI